MAELWQRVTFLSARSLLSVFSFCVGCASYVSLTKALASRHKRSMMFFGSLSSRTA